MASYEHLPLLRLEEIRERRKTGRGTSPVRDAKSHGAALSGATEKILSTHKAKQKISDVDPSLILKVRTVGAVDPDVWPRMQMDILATQPRQSIVLFANDSELPPPQGLDIAVGDLLKSLPNSSANLIRALLALSAHRPEPAVACLTGRDEEEVAFVLGKGIPQLESAIASEDNRVILYAEDEIPADHFAVFEVPIPAVFHSTPGTKEISVALAFDPPVRRSRQEYLGNLMSFDLFRGADPSLVFDHCRKWDKKAEGKAPYKLANKYRCDLSPGIKLRKRTTLQTGHFSASRDMSQYGERYFLTVRCEAGWSGEDQSFAVAVELKHAAEIPLYVEVQRIRIRT